MHPAGPRWAVLWLSLSTMVLPTIAQRPESSVAAETFCSADARTLACDWAGDAEQSKTATGTFGGTLWTGELNPPQVLSQDRTYYQIASKVVSLACPPGRLNIRTVFKHLPGSQGCSRLLLDADTLGSLGAAPSTITRCQLRLSGAAAAAANGTDAAAVQAALAAPDIACLSCKRCAECPHQVGVWYSDSGSFMYSGCSGVKAQPNMPYTPTKPGIVINPGNNLLLAAITVKPTT